MVNEMNFAEILIIVAASIFALIVLLLRWAGGLKTEIHLTSKPRRRQVFNVYCAALLVLGIFSVYCAVVGQRPFTWFALFGLIGAVSLYFGSSSKNAQRNIASLAIVFFVLMQSVTPIIENRGVMFGPDQWRDVKVTLFIMNSGSYRNAPGLETGFYGFIPLFNVLNVAVTEVTGFPVSLTFIVLLVILSLIFALSFYALLMILTGKTFVALIAILFFVSVPRLALDQSLPSTASISLGVLLIFLLLKGALNRNLVRSVLLTIAIMVFAVSVFHPMGAIPILVICPIILVLNLLIPDARLNSQSLSFVRGVFIISLTISVTYWFADAQVFAGVINPLLKFLHTLLGFGQGPSVYSPQYFGGGYEIFSIAWAVPVSISAAFLIMLLWSARAKMRRSMLANFSQHFFFASSLAGLLLVGVAFISILASPGAAVERYINVPAYAFLVFPASLVLGQLLSSRKKVIVCLSILVFLVSLVVGMSSPDWAPFENPTFGAVRFTYSSSREVNTLARILPNNSRLYEDHDIPLAEMAELGNVSFITDKSYQTTRSVIDLFRQNQFASNDVKYENAIIVLKIDEIVDQNILSKHVNIIYSSGRHVVISPQ